MPQLSMSGGTMIALCGKEIWMGSHSNLGPIDPQFGPYPAQMILSEFYRIHEEIKNDPSRINVWNPILSRIEPTFITQCEQAIKWSKSIGLNALTTGMFSDERDAKEKAQKAVDFLTDTDANMNHSRHLHRDECRKNAGLIIKDFEDDQDMQEAILSIHHSNMLCLMNTPAIKIIENHDAVSFIKVA